jgi:proteasome assembly chaperone (PAC2) family protein
MFTRQSEFFFGEKSDFSRILQKDSTAQQEERRKKMQLTNKKEATNIFTMGGVAYGRWKEKILLQ